MVGGEFRVRGGVRARGRARGRASGRDGGRDAIMYLVKKQVHNDNSVL